LAELQPDEADVDASEVPSPESLAAFVLRRAHDIARELPDHMVHQAETERYVAEESITQVIEEARARSAEIIGAAQRDRERVGFMIDQARRQIDVDREQASGEARERVQRTWQEATVAFAELEVEMAEVRAQRDAVVSELSQLDKAVEESRSQLRKRDAIDVDVVAPVDSFEPGPERRRWALMPVEW
jgi:type I site-specific restriction endonuclease